MGSLMGNRSGMKSSGFSQTSGERCKLYIERSTFCFLGTWQKRSLVSTSKTARALSDKNGALLWLTVGRCSAGSPCCYIVAGVVFHRLGIYGKSYLYATWQLIWDRCSSNQNRWMWVQSHALTHTSCNVLEVLVVFNSDILSIF